VSISLGGGSPIGWFPLGPREVYVPSYQASRDYFKGVNVTNTVINNTVITNVYNNYSSGTINVNRENYANRRVSGAVTVVPRTVFVNAQPVRPAVVHVDPKAVTTSKITRLAPIAPSMRSVIGLGKVAGARPAREVFDRPVFARNAPPPAERPFAAREQQLQKHPGRAPEPSAVKSEQSRDDNTARKVRVIGEQRGALDARAAGSRRGGGNPDTTAATPGQLRPLDRSVEPANESGPVPGDRSRDKESKGQGDTRQQQQPEQQKQQQDQLLQRKAASEKQAVEKQPTERNKRHAQTQQERQVECECERQAIEQHQDPRQCQSESQPKGQSGNPNRDRK
jgi:hypothetical protein